MSGGHGYWLVGADGGIFSFGGAGFYGSTGSLVLQRPVVGIAPTGPRRGYWLVATDGGVFAFGDAGYYGSLPGLGIAPAGTVGRPALAAPIVGIVPSTDAPATSWWRPTEGSSPSATRGSPAPARGSAGAPAPGGGHARRFGEGLLAGDGHRQRVRLRRRGTLRFARAAAAPVTSAVRTPDGGGYGVLYADGRVDPFGDAVSHGDPEGALAGTTAAAVFATSDGAGYWVATTAGRVDAYGDAPVDGSMAGAHLNAPIVAASGW